MKENLICNKSVLHSLPVSKVGNDQYSDAFGEQDELLYVLLFSEYNKQLISRSGY